MYATTNAQRVNRKIKITLGAVCIVFFIIIVRLVQFQIWMAHNFAQMGQKNFSRFERVIPERGNILDVNGTLLATNRPVTSLYWKGSGNNKFDNEQHFILREIEKIIGAALYDDQEYMRELSYAEKFYRQYPLSVDITFDQLSKITEQFPNHKNIEIITEFKRLYPFTTLASHALGYLGDINLEASGQMGLEKVYEDALKGESGMLLTTINSIGRSLGSSPLKQPQPGKDLVTTIDLRVQQLAESLFPAEYKGAMIVMSPHDGSLAAVVSRPCFDPNVFLNPMRHDEWQALQHGMPFLNRAFGACYPPASLFKLITISAAFETHIITPETLINCTGSVWCGNRKFHCKKREGHGILTAEQAVAQSCNVFFYEIGKRLKIDTLASFAKKFGLGVRTSTIFPEKDGLVPTCAWKLQTHGEKWRVGETMSAVIGQSFNLVTPIQMACMIGGIFEENLVTPRILVGEPVKKQPMQISSKTLNFLRQSMSTGVLHGTSVRVNLRGFTMYAKTGTSQTSDLSKRALGKQFLEHAWFAAYFKYQNQEPLVLVILLENAGGSEIATAYAREFFMAYRAMINREAAGQPREFILPVTG